eukprot:g1366.t1
MGEISIGFHGFCEGAIIFLIVFTYLIPRLTVCQAFGTAITICLVYELPSLPWYDQRECHAFNSKEKLEVAWVLGAYSIALLLAADYVYRMYKHDAQLNRKIKDQVEDMEVETEMYDRIMEHILPTKKLREILESGSTVADQVSCCSVMFAYMYGLDSEEIRSLEQHKHLNYLFSKFDDEVDNFDTVEKIKTIGCDYMCVSGIKKASRYHTENIADFAFKVIEIIKEYRSRPENEILRKVNLSWKIGIASGPAVGGVIGGTKFTYDVFGDTVNTASRMYSHSTEGNIMTVGKTAETLKKYFNVIPHPDGILNIKGKGPMQTYYIQGRKEGTLRPRDRYKRSSRNISSVSTNFDAFEYNPDIEVARINVTSGNIESLSGGRGSLDALLKRKKISNEEAQNKIREGRIAKSVRRFQEFGGLLGRFSSTKRIHKKYSKHYKGMEKSFVSAHADALIIAEWFANPLVAAWKRVLWYLWRLIATKEKDDKPVNQSSGDKPLKLSHYKSSSFIRLSRFMVIERKFTEQCIEKGVRTMAWWALSFLFLEVALHMLIRLFFSSGKIFQASTNEEFEAMEICDAILWCWINPTLLLFAVFVLSEPLSTDTDKEEQDLHTLQSQYTGVQHLADAKQKFMDALKVNHIMVAQFFILSLGAAHLMLVYYDPHFMWSFIILFPFITLMKFFSFSSTLIINVILVSLFPVVLWASHALEDFDGMFVDLSKTRVETRVDIFWHFMEWLLPTFAVCHMSAFQNQRNIRRRFLKLSRLKHEETMMKKKRDHAHTLFEKMPIPPRVMNDLQEGKPVFRESFATVLFADIKSFTVFSGTVTAMQLVKILNSMFMKFDKLAKHHTVEKIKTIGDCYVAASGIFDNDVAVEVDAQEKPLRRDTMSQCLSVFEKRRSAVPLAGANFANHATRMVFMGLDMHKAMLALNAEFSVNLMIRVGIHSGHVMGGILGTKRLAFDIWGYDVELANEFEAGGVPKRVNVSETTYQRAKDQFDFELRKELMKVEMHGNPPIELKAYLVIDPDETKQDKDVSKAQLDEEKAKVMARLSDLIEKHGDRLTYMTAKRVLTDEFSSDLVTECKSQIRSVLRALVGRKNTGFII